MVSFDALRSAHLGAASYLCKKQPPEQLLFCYPLNGILSDKSRYNNINILQSDGAFETVDGVTYLKGGTCSWNELGLSGDFTFEFTTRANSNCWGNQVLSLGPLSLVGSWGDMNKWKIVCKINGTTVLVLEQQQTNHICVQRLSGVLSIYQDGSNKYTTQNESLISGIEYTGNAWFPICNLRLVRKAITPIPVARLTPFTGYEPL